MADRAARWSRQLPLIVGTVAVVLLTATTAAVLFPSVRSVLGISFGAQPPAEGDVLGVALPDASGAQRAVVIFGRSSCSSCRAAAPFLAELVRELAGTPVLVYFVSSEQSASEEAEFARRLGVEAARVVLVDGEQLNGTVFPAVAIVDARGVIQRYWGPGAVSARSPDLVQRFRALAGESGG